MRNSKWKEEEIKIIKDNYEQLTDEELHQLIPNHSKISIECKRRKLGLKRPHYKKYTYADVVYEFSRKENYSLLSNENEFIDCNSKMRYICHKHTTKGEQKITLNHLRSGRGCYYCGLESSGEKRRLLLNKDSDKKLCEENNFQYIDTIRKKGKIKFAFICNSHLELGIQYMDKQNIERGIKGCKYCSGKQLPEWYVINKAEEIAPCIKLLEPYESLTKSMNCLCIKHNYPTRKNMQQILKGQGCYYCGLEKLSEYHTLTLEQFQEKVNNKNQNIIALEYNGAKKDAKFECKLCGHIWYSNPASIKQCPKCVKFYSGEKKISQLLDLWGISYIEQYKFTDCKDKRALPFDFYLIDNNVCIEFDGEQHYKQRNGWTNLDLIKKHDQIKDIYCKKKKINLIRIPYWELDYIEHSLFDKLVKYDVLEEIKHTA